MEMQWFTIMLEKIKKCGMTFTYAGSEKGDDSKFIGIKVDLIPWKVF